MNENTRFIFVTGGVVSGLGKGITAASLGYLLKNRGFKVSAQKLDPYMNIDPGTMSPLQHGEVFVTEDGAETDLDLGHYERFIDEDLDKFSNLTSGKVYFNVLEKERKGNFLGQTVQVIPHITNEIKSFIYEKANTSNADFVLTEIGGTVGDIESLPYMEAIRQIIQEQSRNKCLLIHVTLVPFINSSGEYKSKPTQHSVKELQALGLNPNIIVTRSNGAIGEEIKKKIASFCNVKEDCVIENTDLSDIYEAPLMLSKNGLDKIVLRELNIETKKESDLFVWQNMVDKLKHSKKIFNVAIVGKYVKLHDAYLSIIEALKHAAAHEGVKIEIKWIMSEKLNKDNIEIMLSDCHGILVPGGFGHRGVDGKILACKFARENNIPYFGICLGMQVAVIEFAKNVCGIENANSGEFCKNGKNNVIDLMPDQHGKIKGGTMRLGKYPCELKKGSLLEKAYQKTIISERHRHRYEFNNIYKDIITKNGMSITGEWKESNIVEAVEIPKNRFFVAVQFHPEFKSRPTRPHPLFLEFVKNFRE